jgi:hypothetical protein
LFVTVCNGSQLEVLLRSVERWQTGMLLKICFLLTPFRFWVGLGLASSKKTFVRTLNLSIYEQIVTGLPSNFNSAIPLCVYE